VNNILVKYEDFNYMEKDLIISKNEWNYSIDIKIDISILSVSALDFKKKILISLKCYIMEITSMIKNIYIISKEENDEINIYYKINMNKIKKIKILDFEIWIDEIINEEKTYFINSKFIGFRIIFFKESIAWREGRIYPNISNKITEKLI